MAALQAAGKRYLESLFGTRVSFDRRERKLYGHDTAEIPSLIKPIVGSTVPEAVVQPSSEEELVALVHWAQENRVALTPRGRATSGYGGALPSCVPARSAACTRSRGSASVSRRAPLREHELPSEA